jgi:hypothetical protein
MESLANAYENNKDGWGICYQDPTTSQLIINKQLLDFEEFKKAWAEVPDNVHVGVHFRWRTHGDLSVDNVHPYMILDKSNGDPVDLALMHNGVISYIHKSGDPRSDTQMYVDLILRPILKDNWKLIYNTSFACLVERDISSGSKFLILPSEGAPVIFNEDSGHEEKDQPGVWYSNSYSIKTSTWRATKNAPATSYSYPAYNKGASKGYTSNGTFWDSDDRWGYNPTAKSPDTAIDEFVWPVDFGWYWVTVGCLTTDTSLRHLSTIQLLATSFVRSLPSARKHSRLKQRPQSRPTWFLSRLLRKTKS